MLPLMGHPMVWCAGDGRAGTGLRTEPGAGCILQRPRLVAQPGRAHHAPGLVLEPPRP